MSVEDDVRRLSMALPEVSERPCYSTPAFYVAGKIFARIHEDPGVLVCWCPSVEDREALIAAAPVTFFTTDHYQGHASVLVRLDHLGTDELSELLTEAWLARAPKRVARSWTRSRQP